MLRTVTHHTLRNVSLHLKSTRSSHWVLDAVGIAETNRTGSYQLEVSSRIFSVSHLRKLWGLSHGGKGTVCIDHTRQHCPEGDKGPARGHVVILLGVGLLEELGNTQHQLENTWILGTAAASPRSSRSQNVMFPTTRFHFCLGNINHKNEFNLLSFSLAPHSFPPSNVVSHPIWLWQDSFEDQTSLKLGIGWDLCWFSWFSPDLSTSLEASRVFHKLLQPLNNQTIFKGWSISNAIKSELLPQ